MTKYPLSFYSVATPWERAKGSFERDGKNEGNKFSNIKPDGVERKLVGKIIQRFEDKGIDLLHLKFERLTVETVKEHYEHLKDELFFPELLAYMTSGPVVVMVVVGDNVVKKVRKLVGATNPLDAESGTLRADYGLSVTKNLIHASDSVQSAKIEMQRFFG